MGARRLYRLVSRIRGSHRGIGGGIYQPDQVFLLETKNGKVSALVLVVGLALELVASSRLSVINRQVVGILSAQAADATQRAAHADKAPEEERAARVKLEAEVESDRLRASIGRR
jgi:hypothetical protein